MSLVVSDSGPVHYLLLCDSVDVIPKLWNRLVLPSAVVSELTHPHAPPIVLKWVRTLPEWASVQSPAQIDPLSSLGLGERQAIALAIELKASYLLTDDRAARRAASQRGVLVAGTIGILEQAAVAGLLELPQAIRKLLSTNFRIDSEVVRDALARDARRRNPPSA